MSAKEEQYKINLQIVSNSAKLEFRDKLRFVACAILPKYVTAIENAEKVESLDRLQRGRRAEREQEMERNKSTGEKKYDGKSQMIL